MTQELNCKQLSTKINIIKSKRIDFDVVYEQGDIASSVKLMKEILSLINEANDQIWTLEILTKENIAEQYNKWQEAYKGLGFEYELPSQERVFEFLKKNHDFRNLMKRKEKQGLTKMIIAPAPGFYSLEQFFHDTEIKIIDNDGYPTEYDDTWLEMFEEEDKVRYFGAVDKSDVTNPKPVGGANAAEILANPEKYGVCDGWLISFTTDEKELQSPAEPVKIIGNRHAIQTNTKLANYHGIYFSDRLEEYEAEKAMIPQEYLAMFIKDFYFKYIKIQRKFLDVKNLDLPDSESCTCFVSTYLPDAESVCFPEIVWDPGESMRCLSDKPTYHDTVAGVRSVVRNIKS